MSTGIEIKKKLAILNEGASVTTDASSIDFVGSGVNSSTVGNNVTVTIPGGSGNTTYYMNATIPETPYAQFSSVATTAVEQVLPWTVDPGLTEVAFVFQTPSGVPNTTQIPGGLWQFFLHFNSLGVNENWIIRPTVYKRDLGGTETLLFTADPQIINNLPTVTTMYVCDGVFPATTLLTTDRLVVKIALQNTGVSTQTLNFRTEGSQHYSVAFTTLNQVISGGSVTSVTGTAPIVSSGGTTPAISIPQATAIADGYLSSSDWSVFNAKQDAITLTTIGTSGAATLVGSTLNVPNYATSSGGVWGIANSSGVYTYYATWALAVAAATSGQCIELFADITESSVSYTLKNGVNVNGNGHTISSNTVTSTLTDGGVAVACDISNLIINKSAGTALNMTSTSSIITGNCKIIGAGTGDMCSVYGQLNGWIVTGSMTYPIALYSTGILSNITINNTGGNGVQIVSTTTKINNCYIKTSGTAILNSGISGGVMNNNTIISNGIGVSTYVGEINNCSIQSNTLIAVYLGANSTANNCVLKSSTNNVVSAPSTSSFNGCTIIAEANAISDCSINYNNCILWSKIDWVLNQGGGGKVINCKLTTGYNSVNGWVINEPTSNTYVVDCVLEVANSGTTAIRSTTTPTLYLKGNSVKGTTNFKSAGIVNGQTNTADAQGNVILN